MAACIRVGWEGNTSLGKNVERDVTPSCFTDLQLSSAKDCNMGDYGQLSVAGNI